MKAHALLLHRSPNAWCVHYRLKGLRAFVQRSLGFVGTISYSCEYYKKVIRNLKNPVIPVAPTALPAAS